MTVVAVLTHVHVNGRLHIPHTTVNINEVQDLTLFLLKLWPTNTLWSVRKTYGSALLHTLRHNHLMKCFLSVVNPIVATALLMMSTLHCC